MSCRCGAHVCWRCLGVFSRETIYEHMGTAHGGYYAEDHAVNAPVDYAEQERLLRQAADARRAAEARRVAEVERAAEARRANVGHFSVCDIPRSLTCDAQAARAEMFWRPEAEAVRINPMPLDEAQADPRVILSSRTGPELISSSANGWIGSVSRHVVKLQLKRRGWRRNVAGRTKATGAPSCKVGLAA